MNIIIKTNKANEPEKRNVTIEISDEAEDGSWAFILRGTGGGKWTASESVEDLKAIVEDAINDAIVQMHQVL
jgi:hypothetical protein